MGGDICVGDSGGSCILVDILVMMDGGGGWRCWRVVLVGCVGGLCNWVVLVVGHVDFKLSSRCAVGMRAYCGEGVYSCCIVDGW